MVLSVNRDCSLKQRCQLVFVMESRCVSFTMLTECLNIYKSFGFRGLRKCNLCNVVQLKLI